MNDETDPRNDWLIEVRDVHKSFGDDSVLKGVDLKVARGGTVFIVGPSGCGKSVLTGLIVGLHRPDSGQILVDKTPVPFNDRPGLRALRRKIALVRQHPALFDSMDVCANISLPLTYHKEMDSVSARETALNLLKRFGMAQRLNAMPAELNASDRKIVSILRSLATEPECLILDEPTTGLDAEATRAVDTMISELGGAHSDRMTLIVVSHDMLATLSIADRVVFLYNGVVRLQSRASDFRSAASQDPVANQFLSGEAAGPMLLEVQ